jgi:hypothetical protein
MEEITFKSYLILINLNINGHMGLIATMFDSIILYSRKRRQGFSKNVAEGRN